MREVRLVLCLNFLANSLLYVAVWNVLLQHLGFSIGDLSVYITVCFLTQTLCEIPSGWASDHWGARRTLTLGQLFLLIALVLFAVFPAPVTLVALAVGTGVANALYSDTDTTLVYQRLCQLGRAHHYPRFLAFYNSLGFVGEGVAALVGSLLADRYGLTQTLWYSIPLVIVHVLLVQLLARPKTSRCPAKSKSIQIWQQGWRQLRLKRQVRVIMAYSLVIYTLNMLVWYYYQNYAEIIDLPLFYYGVLAIGFSVCEALPQYLARFFINYRHWERLYLWVVVITCLCLLVATWRIDQLGLLYLFLSVCVTGFTFPLTETLLRRGGRVQSWTGLVSFKTFVTILAFALSNVIFGTLADYYGLARAFQVTALSALALVLIFDLSQRRRE